MGAVIIEAMPSGGFLVRDRAPCGMQMDQPLLAATTLDEALAYVRTRMRPEGEAADLPTREQIAEAAAIDRAFARDMDQGALSRQAMTAAVERRIGGLWRA